MDISGYKEKILPLNGRLYRYALMMLKDHGEAQDAVQEVCLKLWKIKDTLENYRNIESFAIKVTKNWCLDRIKLKKPVYVNSYTLLSPGDYANDPYKRLENEDQIKFLFRIMEKLPDQQRDIIQLREIENLEFEEIAEILEMNINAVRVNLSRARHRIKEEMLKFESHEHANKTPGGKVF